MAKTKDAGKRKTLAPYNPPENPRDIPKYHRSRMVDRKITEGREVTISEFPDLLDDFSKLNWQTFILQKGPIYPKHIREFYANFEFSEESRVVKFRLYNNEYTWSLQQFGEALSVPFEGTKFYSRGHVLSHLPEFVQPNEIITLYCKPDASANEIHRGGLKSKHLLPKFDLWDKIISFNIYCKCGNHSNVHATQAALIWSLDHEIPVNMAYLIASRMSGLQTESTRALPYGILLNNLFNFFNLPHNHSQQLSHQPINRRTLVKAGHISRKRQASQELEDEDEEDLEDLLHQLDEDVEEEEQAGTDPVEEPRVSSDEDLAPYDPSDPFYTMDSPKQREILYRQNLARHKSQSKIKKLLKNIFEAISCRSSGNVATGSRRGRGRH